VAQTAPGLGILPEEAIRYYEDGREAGRLFKGIGPLELTRTQELIERFFPAPPAVVLDVGGGPGIYSCWLARLGYKVHLVDALPLHVEQARQASDAQAAQPIASLRVGDARHLGDPDETIDAVLLHGPLYHLTERSDRLAALREGARVLRPRGVLLAIGISRYASTLLGLVNWWIEDAEYLRMIERELEDGCHRPPASWPGLFTTAYFHRPGELGAELQEAGLIHEGTLAIQGPGWLVPDFAEKWASDAQRGALLQVIRLLERDPAALALTPHLMAIGRKSQGSGDKEPRTPADRDAGDDVSSKSAPD
jgi:ubiquinone/menaquinone biosynthesis C-methylase UbiE